MTREESQQRQTRHHVLNLHKPGSLHFCPLCRIHRGEDPA